MNIGYAPTFESITGKIFEFGFPDAILQMLAAFLYEYQSGTTVSRFASCVTPNETIEIHKIFTSALASHHSRSVVPVD